MTGPKSAHRATPRAPAILSSRARRPAVSAATFCGLLLLASGTLQAQGSTGGPLTEPIPGNGVRGPPTECCLELLFPVTARGAALGRAMTALASPDAAFANPAGLAPLVGDHFVMHRSSLIGEVSAFSLLFTPRLVGTVGLSYQLVDFGDIESRDEQNQSTGVLALRNHLLVASFATSLGGGVSAGLNYKLYQIRNRCSGVCGGPEVTARHPTTHALDAGMQFRPVWLPALQLGVAVTNLGFPLQVVNVQQADPLPTRIRFGIAVDALHLVRLEENLAAWIALELEENWHSPGAPVASVGVEIVATEMLFIRAGYVPGEGLGTGVSFGLGVHYSRFTLGIARSLADPVIDPDREVLQLTFGLSI